MTVQRTADDAWLQERLAYWQKHLRLEDWRIRAWFVPAYEMSREHAQGTLDYDMPSKHARIRLLVPDQIEQLPEIETDPHSCDPETFLVHELLHLSMADLDFLVPEEIDQRGSPFELAEERHVSSLSKLLVELDRK